MLHVIDSAPPVFRIRVNRAFKAMDDGVRRKWVLVIAARDLPPNLPLDANARVPNVVKNDTCREMRATLLTKPEMFQVFNGGIVCTANTVEIKQEGDQHIAYISFNHNAEQGIVNGGHTYACLGHVLQDNVQYSEGKTLRALLMHDAKRNGPELEGIINDEARLAEQVGKARERAQVQIEVVAPIANSELLAEIARARNLSQGVEATALANLAGKFDFMKQVLLNAGSPFGQSFVNRVVWKTNQEVSEDGPQISVKLLIQVLALMNIHDYPSEVRTAASVYARSGVVVREFSEAEGEKEEFFKSLSMLLPDFLELYDAIYQALPQLDPNYPWADGRIGNERRQRSARTPFMGHLVTSKVASAFVWPIFSAFRMLLTEDAAAGTIRFCDDPFTLFDETKTKLVGMLQNFHKNQVNGMVQMVGKSSEIWARIESRIGEELRHRERVGSTATPYVPRLREKPIVVRDDPLDEPFVEVHGTGDAGCVIAPSTGLLGFVSDRDFVCARNTTERFLAALAWCYRQKPDRFPFICETVRGRHRVYFSNNAAEIEDSGTSTNPKQIPGSPFWVATNASNDFKREILTRILEDCLGYGVDIVRRSLAGF